MTSKHERAVGAILMAFAAFFVLAATNTIGTASGSSAAIGLANTASTVMIVLALVAAIPGFFLLFRRGAV